MLLLLLLLLLSEVPLLKILFTKFVAGILFVGCSVILVVVVVLLGAGVRVRVVVVVVDGVSFRLTIGLGLADLTVPSASGTRVVAEVPVKIEGVTVFVELLEGCRHIWILFPPLLDVIFLYVLSV